MQGANIDSADKHGISPLLAAIWEGHTSCVKFLVEKVFLPTDTILLFTLLYSREHPSRAQRRMALHTWRRRRRRRSKPCSDNPESAKTCDIIGQNTVLLYTTTTKLDFFLRQNLIQQKFFDLIWSHFMAKCSIFLHLSSVYLDISRFVEQLWGHYFICKICLE